MYFIPYSIRECVAVNPQFIYIVYFIVCDFVKEMYCFLKIFRWLQIKTSSVFFPHVFIFFFCLQCWGCEFIFPSLYMTTMPTSRQPARQDSQHDQHDQTASATSTTIQPRPNNRHNQHDQTTRQPARPDIQTTNTTSQPAQPNSHHNQRDHPRATRQPAQPA